MPIASTNTTLKPRRRSRVHALLIATGLLIGPASGGVLTGCSAPDAAVDPARSSPSAEVTLDDDQAVDDDAVTYDDQVIADDESASGDSVDSALPSELLGLWVSIDQGDAETIYRFVADGTYDQVSLLMQARPSGTFSFMINATGLVQIDGERMLLTPISGTEAMEDPDSPSSNFDRPLDPLTPEEFIWIIEDGTLFLTGQYGTVGYEWTPEG